MTENANPDPTGQDVPATGPAPQSQPPAGDDFKEWLYRELQVISARIGHPLPPPPWGTDTGGRSYTTQAGDTLGSVAAQYLGDVGRWGDIKAPDGAIVGPADDQGAVQPASAASVLRPASVLTLPDA